MWLLVRLRRAQRGRSRLPAHLGRPARGHDNLFHTVLGLLDVRTTVRDDAFDLTALPG